MASESAQSIVRVWRGWTRAADADAYEQFLNEELFPAMAEIRGFVSAEVLRRPDGEQVSFLTLTRFSSLEAIQSFAGDDPEAAVIEPRAAELLSHYDARAVHYES